MINVGSVRDRLGAAVRLVTRPTGPRPRPALRGQVFDVALALLLCVGATGYALDAADGQVRIAGDGKVPVDQADRGRFVYPVGGQVYPILVQVGKPAGPGGVAGLVALAVVASLSLALRRRFPLSVLWTVMVTAVLTPHDMVRLTFYALVIAVFSAAAYSPYRVPTLATLPVSLLVVSTGAEAATVPYQYVRYVPILILVTMALVAHGLRAWKLWADESRTRLTALEREQAEALRRAVELERARIARELHDVVTHNVSVMVIQAGAARKVMAADPGQAGEALLAVEAGGRAAMTELRQVMGLLTMDGDGSDPADTADLTPQPGLRQLEALVKRLPDSGVAVDLSVVGPARPLPPGVELTAYRVVQEALTNTVKHASGARATVTIEYGQDRLRVEVADTGGRPGATAGTGSGRGLVGLRERLAVHGGTLRTGRRLSGGYRVEATIPLEAP
ncbi:sensor histidine kinase [Wenjunlia vitaminophila]|uniref:sensor histidine kinase n=1 Tax=Wenjunlia vitaminophila TaxID=76728 RepID=UPI00037374AF|nr:sensor histidine kinase [Wenjunlia vitaminophila]